MNKKVLIFGATGGLGTELSYLLEKRKYRVIKVPKNKINFLAKKINIKINKLLLRIKPDVIVNCSGYFKGNNSDFEKIFKINTYSNWLIIKFYIYKKVKKKVKIILIGSSAYKGPRKNYILYSASKAALHNVYLGAKELLEKKLVSLKIVHPEAMKTKMINNIINKNKIKNPSYYAKKILKLI